MQKLLQQQNGTKTPVFRMTPTVWAKIQYARSLMGIEITGFGIADKDDLLLVRDVIFPKQIGTAISSKLDDAGLADYVNQQVDKGLKPSRFWRIWIHTHPGDGISPSPTDTETFHRVFTKCDWAVMVIVGDKTMTAKLHCKTEFGMVHQDIPCRIEFMVGYDTPLYDKWMEEIAVNITEDKALYLPYLPCQKAYDYVHQNPYNPDFLDYADAFDEYGAVQNALNDDIPPQNNEGLYEGEPHYGC